MLAFLKARAIDGVECIDGEVYCRTVLQEGLTGTVEVSHLPRAGEPQCHHPLSVGARAARHRGAHPARVRPRRRRRCDRRASGAGSAAGAADRGAARPARARRLGRIRAGGARRAGPAGDGSGRRASSRTRLVQICGAALPAEQRSRPALQRAFPTAAQVAKADLSSLGMPNARKAALVALAQAALAGPVPVPAAGHDRGNGGAAARDPRHRRMDRALHRAARGARDRRVSRQRHRPVARRRRSAPARGRARRCCRIARRRGGLGGLMPRSICGRRTRPRMVDVLQLLIDRIKTPIGELAIVADEDGALRAVEWTEHDDRMQRSFRLQYGTDGYALKKARNPAGHSAALSAYFARRLDGDRQAEGRDRRHTVPEIGLEGVARDPLRRDNNLCHAGASASAVRRPCAPSATPTATTRSAWWCRVTASSAPNGSLTGYGGGIERKRWLLAHEQGSNITERSRR